MSVQTLLANAGIAPLSLRRVGSRTTCTPAPTDTDEDWLILLTEHDLYGLELWLEGYGWYRGGSHPDDRPIGGFSSYVRGDQNLLLTCDFEFHRRFIAATLVARRLNLLDKADRIALFQAVLYGNAEGALAPPPPLAP